MLRLLSWLGVFADNYIIIRAEAARIRARGRIIRKSGFVLAIKLANQSHRLHPIEVCFDLPRYLRGIEWRLRAA